jgi:type II secretory pathway pseudopilin PulG
MKQRFPYRRGGWSIVELVVAMGVIAMMATAYATTTHHVGVFNRIQAARQNCTAAAQAELDAIAATGNPLDAQQVEQLWPGVTVHVDRQATAGTWEGNVLLTVTAATHVEDRDISVVLKRYIPEASP